MGTKDITKEKLYDLYINKCFTQQECADYFNCGSSSVGIYLKKYDIPVRNSRSALEIEMDNDMYSILQGALLGDGCLFISKSSINADFEYTSKSYQHVYYVCEKFFPYSLSGIKHYSVYDKRTGKQYNTYKFKTLVSPTLTQEYYKWYTNKIKHIPNNLQLDPFDV